MSRLARATALCTAAALMLTAAPAYAADDPLSMVVVGDSYPAGAFPKIAADELGYDLRNSAVPGSKSSAVPGQLGDATGAGVIVINTGGNDIGALQSLEKALAGSSVDFTGLGDDLTATYSAVKAAAPGVPVIVMNYPDFIGDCLPGDVPGAHRAAAELNETILSAAGNAGVDSLDVSGLFAENNVCSSDSWIADDGHPNAAGHAALGHALSDKIAGDHHAALQRVTPAPALQAQEQDWFAQMWEQYKEEILEYLGASR